MIGIIGGTGVFDSNLFESIEKIHVDTKYGKPSASIKVGEYEGKKIAFLARHGNKHEFPPHNVNYRANIAALKHMGVKTIFAFSAVGSLKEEFKRGDFAIVRHYIDFTKSRERTFYDKNEVIHITMAEPYCKDTSDFALNEAKKLGYPIHDNATYVCIEGPQFSTKAESKLYQMIGGDIIGMTVCPETQLAREAEIHYTCIATITDYDCWKNEPVTSEAVVKTMKENNKKIKELMKKLIKGNPEDKTCGCDKALQGAGL